MNKTELTTIAKSAKLPKGWKILKVYPKHTPAHTKVINNTDSIYVGMPIDFRMEATFTQHKKAIDGILRQFNKGRRGKKNPKFSEWGGGFGGGKYYEVHIAVDYPEDEED